jgi:hypothetical protein
MNTSIVHSTSRLFSLSAILAVGIIFSNSLLQAEAKAPPETADVELDRLVVSDSPPGSIPFAGGWAYNRITGTIIMPPVIAFVGPKGQKLPIVFADTQGKQRELFLTWSIPAPDQIALKHGGQILAIDGIDVSTLDTIALKNIWYQGKAGEPVTLVIRGCGDEMHLFREITVNRISARKEKRLIDEATTRELLPARSLAELPATPETPPTPPAP